VNDERGRRARLEQRGPHDARATTRAGPALRESPAPRSGERPLVTRHPSHKLAASIYCEVDGLPVEIEPLELSTAGLFVETPTPLSIDSEVEVFVRIGDMRFEASGHVVQTVSCEQATQRHRKPGYGLLFTNVDDGARAQLRRGIQALVVQRATASRAQVDAAMPTPTRSVRAGPAANSSVVRPSLPAEPRKPPIESRSSPTDSRKPAVDARRAAAQSPQPDPTVEAPTQPMAAPTLDPAERAVLEKLQAELRALDAKTPWAVLGISQGSDLPAAKCAFFAASKRYHPHLYARYRAAEIKTVVTELFIAHKRAYTTLLKSSKSGRQSIVEHAPVQRAPSKQPGPGNK
jgi:hypothetical protein